MKIWKERGTHTHTHTRGRPRNYQAALYSKNVESDARAVCALASGTLGQRAALESALRECGLLPSAARHPGLEDGQDTETADILKTFSSRRGLVLVLAYELLLGKGLKKKAGGGGIGRFRRLLLSKQDLLKKKLDRYTKKRAAEPPEGVADSDVAAGAGRIMSGLPRYLRINRSLVGTGDQASASLRKALATALRKKHKLEEADAGRDAAKKPCIAEKDLEVKADALVPDVLVVSDIARPLLHGLPLVEEGKVVLQDRSSCLSANAAGIGPGCTVLDACSAPGSKTAHAIDLLQGNGKMVACERDPQRAAALLRRLRQLVQLRRRPGKGQTLGAEGSTETAWFHALCEEAGGRLKEGMVYKFVAGPKGGVKVELHVGDFLASDPSAPPFRDIEVLLADPSCSGSGLPEHHLGAEAAYKPSGHRLRTLAAFQRRILGHALRFPNVRTVVYSTCSTHRIENEDVVRGALTSCRPRPPFKVVEALPWWRNSAKAASDSSLPAWAAKCIHCDPQTHRCRGFFLCRLDRMTEAEISARLEAPSEEETTTTATTCPTNAEASVPGEDKAQTSKTPSSTENAAKADGQTPKLRPKAARKLKRRQARVAKEQAAPATSKAVAASSRSAGRSSKAKKGRAGGVRIGKIATS
eukprot:TRINITY_DN25813_c0_g2_i3.p1 TRINITY_DN25813_c0_g2~~TRINITY_DN25813_c0_g2_i3.p1  ORF type:complete len:642 (+),score=154.53 TRINITY_DN25813_c0_g2_i3:80-2005(+)